MLELAPGKPKSWLKAKTNTPATFVIGALCGLVVGYVIFSSNLALAPAKDNEGLASQNNAATSPNGSPLVPANQGGLVASLDNQLPGQVVLVKHVEMKEGGWLAIHTDQDNSPGSSILGAIYLRAGSYDNMAISLLKRTEDSNNYWLVAHSDNGDHIFDYQVDLPRQDGKGKIEAIKFSVTAESSRGE